MKVREREDIQSGFTYQSNLLAVYLTTHLFLKLTESQLQGFASVCRQQVIIPWLMVRQH